MAFVMTAPPNSIAADITRAAKTVRRTIWQYHGGSLALFSRGWWWWRGLPVVYMSAYAVADSLEAAGGVELDDLVVASFCRRSSHFPFFGGGGGGA